MPPARNIRGYRIRVGKKLTCSARDDEPFFAFTKIKRRKGTGSNG